MERVDTFIDSIFAVGPAHAVHGHAPAPPIYVYAWGINDYWRLIIILKGVDFNPVVVLASQTLERLAAARPLLTMMRVIVLAGFILFLQVSRWNAGEFTCM